MPYVLGLVSLTHLHVFCCHPEAGTDSQLQLSSSSSPSKSRATPGGDKLDSCQRSRPDQSPNKQNDISQMCLERK